MPLATLQPIVEFPNLVEQRQYQTSSLVGGASEGLYATIISVVGCEEPWILYLSENVARLRALKADWDGPGSLPIGHHILFKAERIVRETLEGRPNVKAPYLVPAGDGSVQIEWHRRNGEIEFLLAPTGEISIWVRSHITGQEFEGDGEKALDLFARWAPRLASEDNHEGNVSPSTEALDLTAA